MTDRVLARAQRAEAVALGLAVFLACGVLVALLAARLLSPRDYTVFAAVSGLFGVLVLAPASSLEQESALRTGAGTAALRPMLRRALVIWAVIALLVLLPLGGWQVRLLGDETPRAVAAIVLGAPVALVLAVLRGIAVGDAAFRLVAAAHAAAGLGTLLLPLALYSGGLRPLTAFVAGVTFAWTPALLLVLLRGRRQARIQPAGSRPRRATAWLVLVNLLVLGNLLAVPPLLRWHVVDLGAESVADTQVLVSISRLTTTAVLGFLPLMLARFAAADAAGGSRFPMPAFVLSTALGGATVVVTALFGGAFVTLLTARDSALAPATGLLAAVPAALLCPAIVLMALAMVRERYALICGGWALGLAVLVATAAMDADGRIDVVLAAIAAAAALPLLALSGAIFARQR